MPYYAPLVVLASGSVAVTETNVITFTPPQQDPLFTRG